MQFKEEFIVLINHIQASVLEYTQTQKNNLPEYAPFLDSFSKEISLISESILNNASHDNTLSTLSNEPNPEQIHLHNNQKLIDASKKVENSLHKIITQINKIEKEKKEQLNLFKQPLAWFFSFFYYPTLKLKNILVNSYEQLLKAQSQFFYVQNELLLRQSHQEKTLQLQLKNSAQELEKTRTELNALKKIHEAQSLQLTQITTLLSGFSTSLNSMSTQFQQVFSFVQLIYQLCQSIQGKNAPIIEGESTTKVLLSSHQAASVQSSTTQHNENDLSSKNGNSTRLSRKNSLSSQDSPQNLTAIESESEEEESEKKERRQSLSSTSQEEMNKKMGLYTKQLSNLFGGYWEAVKLLAEHINSNAQNNSSAIMAKNILIAFLKNFIAHFPQKIESKQSNKITDENVLQSLSTILLTEPTLSSSSTYPRFYSGSSTENSKPLMQQLSEVLSTKILSPANNFAHPTINQGTLTHLYQALNKGTILPKIESTEECMKSLLDILKKSGLVQESKKAVPKQ